MKRITVMSLLLLASCTGIQEDIQTMGGYTVQTSLEVAQQRQFERWTQEARWGDGQAFLRLADCYRDGKGVRRDFLGMFIMIHQAYHQGALTRMEDYAISDNHEYKRCLELILGGFMGRYANDETLRSYLSTSSNAEERSLYGMAQIEVGENEKGIASLQQAAMDGSSLARMLLSVKSWEENHAFDTDYIEKVAEEIPLLYRFLGDYYLESGHLDERLAARYYLMADTHALLTQKEADWLLSYHCDGGDLGLSDQDMRRLECLAQVP